MHTVWFKKSKDKEATKKELLSYRNAFQALTEVLEQELENYSVPDYDSPSWAFRQADINGANRMLRRVLSIIDIKE